VSTDPQAQRRWRAACPNCGAPVEFASAASASAVCGFCRSTLVRDGETLSRIGQSAEVFEDYSPLQLGATGRWMGAGFAVVGRLQRQAAGGNWNEWHLLFDSGGGTPRVAWLGEDNGSFVLSLEAPLDPAPPPPGQLRIGGPLTLAGQLWQVAAIVQATLAAAQGELPRPPATGRADTIVELRNAQGEVGTLEFGGPGPVWSVGRAVALADLALQGLRVTATGESVAEAGIQGRAFNCPSCGASLTPKLAQSKSLVCGQCSAVVDVPEGEAKALGYTAQSPAAEPPIPLGRMGRLSLDGQSPAGAWQVVGYQERCDLPEAGSDDEQSFWREYLLFNRLEGFAFLVDTREGWSLVRPLTGAPAQGPGGGAVWQGRSYALRWRYAARVTHVLGEFYWPVRLADVAQVADYASVDGQGLLSAERTADELVWSGGRTLDADSVRKAFGLGDASRAPLARDASAFQSGGASLLRNIVIALFVIVVLFSLLRAFSADDCQQYKDSFGADSAEYRQCRANGNRVGYGGYGNGAGGSYGGYNSGGGGHK